MTATKRIDGSRAPTTLLERLASEEWVGERLEANSRDDYARKAQILENQLRSASTSIQEEVTPQQMAQYLASQFAKNEMSQATARSLKAALLFWIADKAQTVVGNGGHGFKDYEDAYTFVRALRTAHLPKRTENTSSPKQKSLPKEVLSLLDEYGRKTPGVKYIAPLLSFLRANLLLGLRPEEWFDAAIFHYTGKHTGQGGACLAISIRNSKFTHGRANGAYREILLHGITDTQLAHVLHFLSIIEKHMQKNPTLTRKQLADSFYGPLRNCMANALKRMGYKQEGNVRPTLYSSRHQAVANAKNSGLTDREIAALFGHISTATAKSHYGKKVNSWSKTMFKPSPESLSKVAGLHKAPESSMPTQQMIESAREWLRIP